jgi:hypothetical protein
MTAPTTRLVLLLDLYPGTATAEWLSALPGLVAADHVNTLTGCGVAQRHGPEPSYGAVPWRELAQAVERMAARALDLVAKAEGAVEFYVGGQAYLCLFTHLGYRLQRFKGKHVVLGRRKGDQKIERFDLSEPRGPDPVFVERGEPLAESRAPGGVALCVDTGGRSRRSFEEAIEAIFAHHRSPLAAFYEARSRGPATLTPQNAPNAALELEELFSRLPSHVNKSATISLFLAGPTLLAYLAGRAINPTVWSQPLQLTNHHQGEYTLTYRLPLDPPGPDGSNPFGNGTVRILFLAADASSAGPPGGSVRTQGGRDFTSTSTSVGELASEAGATRAPYAPLDLRREALGIESALYRSGRAGRFDLRTEWAVSVAELRALLEKHQPHIVHFSCHGDRTQGLVLLDEHGQAALVPPQALEQLFKLLQNDPRNDVRLVVLNACWSAAQAQALAQSAGCAVGMRRPIDDETAIEFAASFYENLASGKTIRQAFDLAVNYLDLRRLLDADMPQLFEGGRGIVPQG